MNDMTDNMNNQENLRTSITANGDERSNDLQETEMGSLLNSSYTVYNDVLFF